MSGTVPPAAYPVPDALTSAAATALAPALTSADWPPAFAATAPPNGFGFHHRADELAEDTAGYPALLRDPEPQVPR